MGTTVSRRLVFVKMKRKPLPPPPKYSVRDDKQVGEEVRRPSPAFVAKRAVATTECWPMWKVVGCSVGGLCLFVGIVALLVSLSDTPVNTGEPAQTASRGGDGYPGYARPSSGGYAGGGTGDAGSRVSSAQAFLNAPFPKRR